MMIGTSSVSVINYSSDLDSTKIIEFFRSFFPETLKNLVLLLLLIDWIDLKEILW